MTGILQAEAVAYRYPQNNYGLAPISLALRPGERLLGALTLAALRKAGFFAYLAEKK
ncbi:MAG: hypothetical protein JXM73_16100 [Anaerolineae bacterium]|nr:hypothetical protein [Anaerolineae bacterium]